MKKLFKTLIALSLVVLTCAYPILGSASSETVTADYAGSCDWLITVKNPEATPSDTSSKTFVISAVALEGTIITLYNFNPETELFEKLYVDGEPLETVVGASGLYAQQITLQEGMNSLMVYATNGVDDQSVRLDINLLSEGFIDKIKSFTIDFANMF